MSGGLITAMIFAIVAGAILIGYLMTIRADAAEKRLERQHELDKKMLDAQLDEAKEDRRARR